MTYSELSDDAKALVYLQGYDGIQEDLDIFTEQGILKEEIYKQAEMIVSVSGCSLSQAISFVSTCQRKIVISDDMFSKITEDLPEIPIVKHNQVSKEARRKWRKEKQND